MKLKRTKDQESTLSWAKVNKKSLKKWPLHFFSDIQCIIKKLMIKMV